MKEGWGQNCPVLDLLAKSKKKWFPQFGVVEPALSLVQHLWDDLERRLLWINRWQIPAARFQSLEPKERVIARNFGITNVL